VRRLSRLPAMIAADDAWSDDLGGTGLDLGQNPL